MEIVWDHHVGSIYARSDTRAEGQTGLMLTGALTPLGIIERPSDLLQNTCRTGQVVLFDSYLPSEADLIRSEYIWLLAGNSCLFKRQMSLIE